MENGQGEHTIAAKSKLTKMFTSIKQEGIKCTIPKIVNSILRSILTFILKLILRSGDLEPVLYSILKPFGFELRRTKSPKAECNFVKLDKYKELIRQFHGCFTDSFFCDLPINKNRCDLLVKLLGTGIGEAMYILAFLHQSIKLDGDVCEFGVAQGATSALLANEVLSFDNKCLWLFDSFEGLPKPSSKDKLIDDIFNLGSIEAYQGKMCCPVESVKSSISEISFPTSRLKIVPGFIEETITGDLLPSKVCFAYVDFDFYQPILTALNFLSEHLSVGGSVIVDDYGFFSSGAKTVVDEFMAAHSHDFKMILPPDWAGHFAILVKGSRPNNGNS